MVEQRYRLTPSYYRPPPKKGKHKTRTPPTQIPLLFFIESKVLKENFCNKYFNSKKYLLVGGGGEVNTINEFLE